MSKNVFDAEPEIIFETISLMIYFIKAWQYSHLNMYALIPAVLTTARRLSTMNGLNIVEKNRKSIKNMLLLNVNFLSREFSLSF